MLVAPPVIRIENISKSYGGQDLFKKASLSLQPRERIGLVGRNGSGKSTLFKMILGEDEPDSGCIVIPNGYRIGHVAQHLKFTKPTVLEEGCLGLPKGEEDDIYKVETILSGLGFSEEEMHRAPETFSGGYQVRLNLAKVLVSNPNLLLLDEPTNYLDIVSIRWIVRFLRRWKHELILISHDRGFMDSVTTHTALIHRETIRKMPGNTAKIYAQVELEESVHEKTRANEAKKRKHMEEFVERFGAKASHAAAAQSRMKMIEKLPKLEELKDIPDLEFNFNYSETHAKRIMEVEGLTFGYDPQSPLINDLSFMLQPEDRIAIIGKNGKGKSTLVKLLAGELHAQHGEIKFHPSVETGYFGQTNIDHLRGDFSVEEEIASANFKLGNTAVRTICGCMLFSGDSAQKRVKVLSGGEKSRVMLGKIIATKTNMLLLDEPTNHLDMQSIDALAEAIDNYAGAVVIVTHSEMLLREIANKLIVFQDGDVQLFNGTYDDFLEKVGWRDDDEDVNFSKKNENPKKQLRQNRAAVITERSRVLKPLQDEIKSLEDRIMQLEKEDAGILAKIEQASHDQNSAKIAELAKQAKSVKDEIDRCFQSLEVATAKYEPLAAKFEEELANIK